MLAFSPRAFVRSVDAMLWEDPRTRNSSVSGLACHLEVGG